MPLVENYLSKLKTNNFASDDVSSKKVFLDYCINTNTAGFFFGRANEEFLTKTKNNNFREIILSSKKKSLRYQSSLKSFLKLAQNHDIDVCLLKGAYMSNFMYPDFSMRSMRDLDILVDESVFLKIVNILLENGYCFLNSNEKELAKFNFNYAHQAPILVDRFGVAFEIHHRLKTKSEINNSDYLTKNLTKNKKKETLFGSPVSIPNENFGFIHCCHHAISKSKLNIGPIFLNDLVQFKNIIDVEVLEEAKKSNCLKEVDLGIQIRKFLINQPLKNKKQVKDAVEIIIHCYKLPEFLPRKSFNLLNSIKESYSFNFSSFSFRGFFVYLFIKIEQIFVFFKTYSLNFMLYKKRNKFFKDFNN